LLEYILRNACIRNGIPYPEKQSEIKDKRRVNVLLGGITSERNVSLLSGTNVWMKLLQSDKYAPVPYILTSKSMTDEWIVAEIPYSFALLHTTDEIISQINLNMHNNTLENKIRRQLGFTQSMEASKTQWISLEDFVRESKLENAYVFIGLHGGFGENGEIQAVFDSADIDYNGSGSIASALCMNKYNTGTKVIELGLSQLRSCKKLLGGFDTTWEDVYIELGSPVIVKPNCDGCSTGVVKICNKQELSLYMEYCLKGKPIPPNTFENQSQPIEMPESCENVLFEEYIKTDPIQIKDGRLSYNCVTGWIEVTIGVLEKTGKYHAFNPSVTVAENAILSVEEKFQGGVGVNLTPPHTDMMSNILKDQVKYFAERIAEKCGVEDYCRIDMFVNNKTGEVIIIEINTLPGLSPSTVLFQQAAKEIPSLSPLALLEYIINPEGSLLLG
jgi:D-alanine--D-alanine ligase